MPKISELTAIPLVDPTDLVAIVDVTDTTTKKATVAQIRGSATVPSGTGFRHVTSGAEDGAAALVTNADVDAAAAIAVTKLATGSTNGQVLQRISGVNSFGLITNANIDASAAIAATKVAGPGLSGQIAFNNAGVLGGTSHWAMGGTGSAGFVGSSSAFVSFDTNPAAAGYVRLPNATGATFVGMRNGTNTADWNVIGMSSSVLTFGDTNMDASIRCFAFSLIAAWSTGFDVIVSGVNSFRATNSVINCAQPIAGDQRAPVPFRRKSAAFTQSSTTATTLTAAQYECPVILVTGTPGGAFNVIGPTTADAWFEVYNGTNGALTFKTSAGTGVTIATTKTAQIRCDGTNYVRCTLDA